MVKISFTNRKLILFTFIIFGLAAFVLVKTGNGKTGIQKYTESKVSFENLLQDEKNTHQIFKEAAPKVAFVHNIAIVQDYFSWDSTAVQQGVGSGFVWDNLGHIVTNFHVIARADKIAVTLQGVGQKPAKFVGAEPRKDIAVLKIALPKQFENTFNQHLTDSNSLIVGQKTIAIGNPFGLDHTLTVGRVSAVGRSFPGIGGVTIRDMIQTDAAINPGNSGGPLLDSRGYLIGMNTAIYSKSGSSAGIGFAVPANAINRIVSQLIQYGKVIQPSIGITRFDDTISKRLGIEGVIVRSVIPNTPAKKARLRGTRRNRYGEMVLGDIIVGIDSTRIRNYDDLYNCLEKKKIGDEVTLKLIRGGKKTTAKIRLAELRK